MYTLHYRTVYMPTQGEPRTKDFESMAALNRWATTNNVQVVFIDGPDVDAFGRPVASLQKRAEYLVTQDRGKGATWYWQSGDGDDWGWNEQTARRFSSREEAASAFHDRWGVTPKEYNEFEGARRVRVVEGSLQKGAKNRYTVLQTGISGGAVYPTDPKGRDWTDDLKQAYSWATEAGAANAGRYWGSHMVVAVPADLASESMRKGAPFAGYTDFADCVAKNQDKDDPEAYCGKIKHEVEGKIASCSHPEVQRNPSTGGWVCLHCGYEYDPHEGKLAAGDPYGAGNPFSTSNNPFVDSTPGATDVPEPTSTIPMTTRPRQMPGGDISGGLESVEPPEPPEPDDSTLPSLAGALLPLVCMSTGMQFVARFHPAMTCACGRDDYDLDLGQRTAMEGDPPMGMMPNYFPPMDEIETSENFGVPFLEEGPEGLEDQPFHQEEEEEETDAPPSEVMEVQSVRRRGIRIVCPEHGDDAVYEDGEAWCITRDEVLDVDTPEVQAAIQDAQDARREGAKVGAIARDILMTNPDMTPNRARALARLTVRKYPVVAVGGAPWWSPAAEEAGRVLCENCGHEASYHSRYGMRLPCTKVVGNSYEGNTCGCEELQRIGWADLP